MIQNYRHSYFSLLFKLNITNIKKKNEYDELGDHNLLLRPDDYESQLFKGYKDL